MQRHAGELPISIIPRPVRIERKGDGGCFLVTKDTTIRAASADAINEARFLAEALRPATAFDLPVSISSCGSGNDAGSVISLSLTGDMPDDEAYLLDVENTVVTIQAASPRGLFYGIQTLLQLLPEDIFRDANIVSTPGRGIGGEEYWTVPCVRVEDRPRFGWRGMHLDSGRHFMPKEFVKKFIDLLALHKMNVFHWHLTEDQGWRVEIQKYPELTAISAWRDETVVGHSRNMPRVYDGRRHGGFYTQDDIREVVAYAARRHIDVIPEIEMPGHTQAVLAAFPELGCREGASYSTGTIWGISKDVFCAGNERTFTFLEDVLTEVMDLFPSRYIHIGGDECRKNRWKDCPKCQARIKKNGLANEHELQSYFVKRIEAFLNEKGRRLIGWDEILEGGLAPNATVMSWRGTEGGIKAVNAGHDVVFAPTDHTYFDYCQSDDPHSEPLAIGGCLPLEKVYGYEPIPESLRTLGAESLRHVLGAQGQLWTEYMSAPKDVEYMAFPRTSALSEVLWSPEEGKDYADFLDRLRRGHLKRLDVLDVNYRRLLPSGAQQSTK